MQSYATTQSSSVAQADDFQATLIQLNERNTEAHCTYCFCATTRPSALMNTR